MALLTPEALAALTKEDIESFTVRGSLTTYFPYFEMPPASTMCFFATNQPQPTFRWRREKPRAGMAYFKFVQRSRGKGKAKRWKVVLR